MATTASSPAIRTELDAALRDELDKALRPELEKALRTQLEKAVRAELEKSLRAQLKDVVHLQVEKELRKAREREAQRKPEPPVVAPAAVPSQPTPEPKVTLKWLLAHGSYQLWLGAVALLLVGFVVGTYAGQSRAAKQLLGQSGAGDAGAALLDQRSVK